MNANNIHKHIYKSLGIFFHLLVMVINIHIYSNNVMIRAMFHFLKHLSVFSKFTSYIVFIANTANVWYVREIHCVGFGFLKCFHIFSKREKLSEGLGWDSCRFVHFNPVIQLTFTNQTQIKRFKCSTSKTVRKE